MLGDRSRRHARRCAARAPRAGHRVPDPLCRGRLLESRLVARRRGPHARGITAGRSSRASSCRCSVAGSGEALILGGLVSWGQVAITLLVGGGLVRTLPVELMSIVQSGDDRVAALAALMLSMPPMLAIGLLTMGARRTGAIAVTGSGLELRHARVPFGDKAGLDDVTLLVARGERVALLGPSGVGKTSLLRAIAGLGTLSSGTVLVDGRDVTAAAAGTPRRRLHAPVPVALSARQRGRQRRVSARRSRRREARRASDRARTSRARAAWDSPRRGPPSTLSGGQRHRVALARALAAEPAVLLLDEPFASLDPELRAEVREAVVEILERGNGPAVVLVTHDVDEAAGVADRLVVLLDGRIAQVGAARGPPRLSTVRCGRALPRPPESDSRRAR